MRILQILSIALLIPSGVFASPTTLDGSDQNLEPNAIGQISIALAEMGARDPMSAQYHSLSYNRPEDQATHVCGYVNLKNAFGAYVGFQAFQVNLGNQRVNIMETAPEEISYNLARMVFDISGCSLLLDLPPRN